MEKNIYPMYILRTPLILYKKMFILLQTTFCTGRWNWKLRSNSSLILVLRHFTLWQMKKIVSIILVALPFGVLGQQHVYNVCKEDTSIFSGYNLLWLETGKKRQLQVLMNKKSAIQLKVGSKYKNLRLTRLYGIPHNGLTIPFNGRDTYVDSTKIFVDEFYTIDE